MAIDGINIDNVNFEKATFESVRDRLALVLTVNFPVFKQYFEDKLAEEQAKPSPDTEKIANWQLSIDCIPDKVYLERYTAVGVNEDRYINVTFVSNPLSDENAIISQSDNALFFVESTANARAADGKTGDERASVKLHRLLAIAMDILRHGDNVTLQFPRSDGVILSTPNIRNFIVGQPNQTMQSLPMISGRFEYSVKINECSSYDQGVAIEGFDIKNDGNGLFYNVPESIY